MHRLDPQFRGPFGEDEPQDDRLRLALPVGVVDDPQPDRPPLALFHLRDAVAKLYRVYVMSLYEHMFECAIASGGKPDLQGNLRRTGPRAAGMAPATGRTRR